MRIFGGIEAMLLALLCLILLAKPFALTGSRTGRAAGLVLVVVHVLLMALELGLESAEIWLVCKALLRKSDQRSLPQTALIGRRIALLLLKDLLVAAVLVPQFLVFGGWLKKSLWAGRVFALLVPVEGALTVNPAYFVSTSTSTSSKTAVPTSRDAKALRVFNATPAASYFVSRPHN
jgi:hypothetical protein